MEALNATGLTMTTTVAGYAAGSTTTYTTANATQYCIQGKAYTKAGQTSQATPTTDATTGATFLSDPLQIGEGTVFVIGWDASLAIKVSQGEVVTLDAAGNFIDAPNFPSIPDTMCPFAYQLVKAAPATATTPAVATWTFGTNNQSSVTGVTQTRVDVMTLPARPQTA